MHGEFQGQGGWEQRFQNCIWPVNVEVEAHKILE